MTLRKPTTPTWRSLSPPMVREKRTKKRKEKCEGGLEKETGEKEASK